MKKYLFIPLFTLCVLDTVYAQKVVVLQPGGGGSQDVRGKDAMIANNFPEFDASDYNEFNAQAWTVGRKLDTARSLLILIIQQYPKV
jgi:hypothetical protein